MTEQTTPFPNARIALKDTPKRSDLENATSPIEYLVETFQ